MLTPWRSKCPLWQAHQMWLKSGRYCTVHPRCVQTAEKALSSFSGVRMRIPGRLPNLKILPEFAGMSWAVKGTVTEVEEDSAASGGIRNRVTGYTKAARSAPKLVPRSQSMNRRRDGWRVFGS